MPEYICLLCLHSFSETALTEWVKRFLQCVRAYRVNRARDRLGLEYDRVLARGRGGRRDSDKYS